MKVILQKTVLGLGKAGDVCNVPDGYAMNLLFPKKMAIVATDTMIQTLQQQQQQQKQQHIEQEQALRVLHKQASGKQITIHKTADHHGKLYQGISAHDIVFEMRKQHGIIIPEKLLEQYKPIKTTGETIVTLQSPGQKTNIIVLITS